MQLNCLAHSFPSTARCRVSWEVLGVQQRAWKKASRAVLNGYPMVRQVTIFGHFWGLPGLASNQEVEHRICLYPALAGGAIRRTAPFHYTGFPPAKTYTSPAEGLLGVILHSLQVTVLANRQSRAPSLRQSWASHGKIWQPEGSSKMLVTQYGVCPVLAVLAPYRPLCQVRETSL